MNTLIELHYYNYYDDDIMIIIFTQLKQVDNCVCVGGNVSSEIRTFYKKLNLQG